MRKLLKSLGTKLAEVPYHWWIDIMWPWDSGSQEYLSWMVDWMISAGVQLRHVHRTRSHPYRHTRGRWNTQIHSTGCDTYDLNYIVLPNSADDWYYRCCLNSWWSICELRYRISCLWCWCRVQTEAKRPDGRAATRRKDSLSVTPTITGNALSQRHTLTCMFTH